MPYDIFQNQSTYPTVCLLIDRWHRTDNCITVCVKWIIDSNFEVAFTLTQDCLNHIWHDIDTHDLGLLVY